MKKNIMTTSLITVMAMNVTAPTVFASNSYPNTDLFESNKTSRANAVGIVTGIAIDDVLNVRESNSTKGRIVFTLKNGESVEIISKESNGWYKIKYSNKTGYANGKYIKLSTSQSNTTAYKTKDDINLRQSASWSGKVLFTIKKNTKLSVVEIKNTWAKVIYKDSIVYAPASYLIKVNEEPVVPETPTVPEVPETPVIPETPEQPEGTDKPETPEAPDNEDKNDATPEVEVIKYKANIDLNLRKTNSWSGAKLTVVKKGETVEYISVKGEWMKAKYKGIEGYLPKSNLTKVITTSTDTPSIKVNQIGTVKSTDLNIRSGPSAKHTAISKVYLNDVVEIEEKNSNGWYKIKTITGVSGWCNGSYLKNVKNGSLPEMENPSELLENVLRIAKEQIGKPYVWGGEGPDSFDCSGLMLYAYKQGANIKLPRDSYMQAEFGQAVAKKDLKPGDLMFFDTQNKGRVCHVGMYIGDGMMLHASSKKKPIQTVDVTTEHWNKIFINARRIIPQ